MRGRWVPRLSEMGEPFSAVRVREIPPDEYWPKGGALLRLGEDYPYAPWRGDTRAFNYEQGYFEADA